MAIFFKLVSEGMPPFFHFVIEPDDIPNSAATGFGFLFILLHSVINLSQNILNLLYCESLCNLNNLTI